MSKGIGKRQQEAEHRQYEVEMVKTGWMTCRKCNETLAITSFHKCARMHTGYSLYCKACVHRDHYLPNKDKYLKRTKAWQAANPEKTKEIRKRDKSKPHNRINRRIAWKIKSYLHDKGLLDTYRPSINCSPKQLVEHLTSQFSPEMSWDNYGTYWHIDHIIPCAAFDWTIKRHIAWCWDHRNLRPFSGEENGAKSDSLPSGESARTLRANNPARLQEIVGGMLEKAGITTATEYTDSWNELASA